MLVTTGCFVDPDEPCGENQQSYEQGGFAGCVCVEDAVPSASGIGCTLCGENEHPASGACVCDTGFARVTEGGACVRSELGADCSASMPCGGAEFPFCAPAGYCTKTGCTSSADCSGGYACNTSASPSYCQRPPAGLGNPCTTDEQCAGLEAGRCAQGSCVVAGCATGPACFSGFACCDFTPLSRETGDICVPNANLMDGKCPFTMADPVTP